jgi:predicted CXXCH cytochrome family protein
MPHQADNAQMLRDSDKKICRSCHSNTEIENNHRGYPVKIQGCLSCHNPHGSNQKALVRNIKHEPFTKGCGSCHDGAQTVSQRKCLQCHDEIESELYATHSHLTDRAGNSCINCHNPHAGDTELLLKSQQTIVCRTCHEDTFRKHEKTLFVHLKTVKDCHNCHAVHGSNQLAMMVGDGNQVCLKCHESQGQFSHPVGKEVIDPRNRQMTTCVSCHTPHGSNFKGELKLSGQEDLCVQCHHM